jgi:DnaJ-domain-containing protein 1
MNPEPRVDYYRLLNVRRDATPEAIQSAYRALARAYHPDRNQGQADPEISRHMSLVNDAYACLGDDSRRRTYDMDLKMTESAAMRTAILSAADELLRKSGWRMVELELRDRVFEQGSRRVGVRFVSVLDQRAFERWNRWANQLLLRNVVEWGVVLSCRVRAVEQVDSKSSQYRRKTTAIDLIDSRMFGSALPDAEYQDLFRPFVLA